MNKNNLRIKSSVETGQSEKTLNQKKGAVGISELKNREPINVTQNNRFYEDIVETIREPLLVLDSDLRVLYANQRFFTAFKVTAQKTIGNLIYNLGNQQWDIPGLRTLLEEIIPEKNRFNDYQIEHDFPTIGKRIMLLNARRIALPQTMQQMILLAIEDVTDRMLSEQALQASEERFRRAFDNAVDGILLIDYCSGQIISSNEAVQSMLGYSLKDFQKSKIWEFGFIKDREMFKNVADQLEKFGSFYFYDTVVKTREDKKIFVDINLADRAKLMQCNIRDITERKKQEKSLQENEEFLNSIVENIPHMIFVKDAKELRFMRFNKAGEELLGFSKPDMYGKNDYDFFPLVEAESFIKKDKETLKKKQLIDIPEETILTKDKGERILHTKKIPILDEKGNSKYLLGISEDITERKLALEALRESRERFSSAFEFASIGMSLVGIDGNYLQVNHAFCEIVGYSEKEMLQKNFQEITHPDDLEADLDYVHQMLTGEIITYQMEKRYIHKLGQIIWILLSVSLIHDKDGKPLYFLSQIQDITKRKRSEQLLSTLNQASVSMLTAETLEDVFTSVSSQLKKLNLASMLFPIDQSRNKLITKYMTFNSIMLSEAESMVGIRHENFSFSIDALDVYKQVIGKKRTVYQENTTALLRQVIPAPFKKFALHITRMLNIPKFIVSPLIVHNTVLGAFIVLSKDLTEEDVPAITAFSNQLAAAWRKTQLIQNLKTSLQERDQAQTELKANFNRIQKSLVDTINAMTSIVEKRDPYTAGHQDHVSKLATAIAIELHLSGDQINAIRTSGLVHDIGKINVPAEILSKPGKLTLDEFRLLKSHPKTGFDILKKIDFPWPVAEIVYQHHERINGTGYPRHLKGDKICIEAKILAVADVVEAMHSHRPYRPALSIKKTLEEIVGNKNSLYDEKVVKGCVRIFKTGKFKF